MPPIGLKLHAKVLTLIIFLLIGHAVCHVRNQEFFPFSHYPLFNHLQRDFTEETSIWFHLNSVSWEPRLRNCFRLSHPEFLRANGILKHGSAEERERITHWLLKRPTPKLKDFKASGKLTLQVVRKRWNLNPEKFEKRAPDVVSTLWETTL